MQRSIQITEPALADSNPSYPAGSTLAVRWSYTGAISNVRVELLYDPDASGDPAQARAVDTVIAESAANSGGFDWVVPTSYEVQADHFVRVSDVGDATVFDVSCEITVGSPQPTAPDAPAEPRPSDDATDVSVNVDLDWRDAAHAASYEVYFGESDPPPLAGDTTPSDWKLPTLNYGTTYFWKVVTANEAGTAPGPVWSFTTQPKDTPIGPVPEAPSGPDPHDSATDVPTDSDLNWNDAAEATSYDVYFGTSNPPPFADDANASNWTPTALSHDATYFWKIVAVNAAGSTPGPVWSFTTQPNVPDAPGEPTPHDGAVDVPVESDFDWSDAAWATSYDVYFGSGDPPPLAGSTDSSHWTPAKFSHATTYYWKVIAVNSAGATPGPVWSFTTEPATSPDMVLIPAGEFQMGDAFSEGTGAEVPVHAVFVDAFYLDTCEITNQQYAAALNWALDQGNLISVIDGVVYQAGSGTGYPYCDTNISSPISRITWDGTTFGVVSGKQSHPMVMVCWYGAVAYCNWRSAMTDKPACYDLSTWACDFGAPGYRLPTEAEWERAARGGTAGHRFPWSDQDTVQHARANYWSFASHAYDTSPTRGHHPLWGVLPEPYTSPVGFFTGELQHHADWGWPGSPDSYQTGAGANDYGLYDMAGNVWEWCNDWYSSDYYDDSPYENPRGPATATYRVMRGGSWDDTGYGCRLANRGRNSPGDRDPDDGFRCAISAP